MDQPATQVIQDTVVIPDIQVLLGHVVVLVIQVTWAKQVKPVTLVIQVGWVKQAALVKLDTLDILVHRVKLDIQVILVHMVQPVLVVE